MRQEEIVAVYGTLKSGEGNYSLLSGRAKFIGSGETLRPIYTMKSMGGFPGVFSDESSTDKIQVEVYSVPPECFESLDRLEGHPNFYVRTKVPIILDDNDKIVHAWMYQLADFDEYSYRPDWVRKDDKDRLSWSRQPFSVK